MRKEIIETGKTVDAAIDQACEKLGCERENCEWEIIDLPKKGFLGLKNIPAKVKVSVEQPDPAPAPREKRVEPAREQPPQRRTEQKRERPPQKERPRSPEREPRPEAALTDEPDLPRELVTGDYTEKERTATDYVAAILKDFGLTANLELYREGSGICIDIVGDNLGAIIGRRGETLDSIQYLTGLVANRLEGDYLRVTVDCGAYRSKRKETLEALAGKLAAQVLKTNVSKTLEPMNPFERRVIHATVSKIEGVTSSSIGEEPNRRVIITSPTARKPSARGGRGRFDRGGDRGGDRRGGGGRDRDRDRDRRSGGRDRDRDRDRRGGGRGPRPPAPKVPEGPPKQTPESQAMGDAPMGKLDLE